MLKLENDQETLISISKILLSQINIKSIKHMGHSRDIEFILNREFIANDQTIVNIFVKILAKNQRFNISETIIIFKNKAKMTTLVLNYSKLHLIYDNLVTPLFVNEKSRRKTVTLKMYENDIEYQSDDHIILKRLMKQIELDKNIMYQGLIKEYPYLKQFYEKGNPPKLLVKV